MASVSRLLILALVGVACARGGGVPMGDGDGGGIMADADPTAPDAPVGGTPDAPPGGTIDAAVPGAADAAAGAPDAWVPSCTPCELVSQCGCFPGQACDLDSSMFMTGGTLCRPVTAMGMDTSTCAGTTTCAPGYTCLGGACREYCNSDTQCTTGPGGLCTIQITYGMPPMDIPGAKVCSPSCDPLQTAPVGCPTAWGCHVYYNSDEMRNFSWCVVAGAGGQNATCTSDTQCQAGYTCTNTGTNVVCLKNCNVTTPGTGCVGTGGTCSGFSPAAVIGAIEYGICL